MSSLYHIAKDLNLCQYTLSQCKAIIDLHNSGFFDQEDDNLDMEKEFREIDLIKFEANLPPKYLAKCQDWINEQYKKEIDTYLSKLSTSSCNKIHYQYDRLNALKYMTPEHRAIWEKRIKEAYIPKAYNEMEEHFKKVDSEDRVFLIRLDRKIKYVKSYKLLPIEHIKEIVKSIFSTKADPEEAPLRTDYFRRSTLERLERYINMSLDLEDMLNDLLKKDCYDYCCIKFKEIDDNDTLSLENKISEKRDWLDSLREHILPFNISILEFNIDINARIARVRQETLLRIGNWAPINI